MSLFGDVFKRVTKTVADVGNTVVDGVSDVTETVTGENAVTRTAREAGTGIIHETKELADGIVDAGEQLIGVGSRPEEEKKQDHGGDSPEKTEPPPRHG